MSTGSTFSVNRPSSIRENSNSSSTILDRRCPSLTTMDRPFWMLSGSVTSPDSSVSLQPLMAVKGVRSSWETEEMNSVCILLFWLIFWDISLMVVASSPISSSYFGSIWIP